MKSPTDLRLLFDAALTGSSKPAAVWGKWEFPPACHPDVAEPSRAIRYKKLTLLAPQESDFTYLIETRFTTSSRTSERDPGPTTTDVDEMLSASLCAENRRSRRL